jgi:hypothetical protein
MSQKGQYKAVYERAATIAAGNAAEMVKPVIAEYLVLCFVALVARFRREDTGAVSTMAVNFLILLRARR